MNPTLTTPSRASRDGAETLTIRMAAPADAAALGRLAQLDSAPPPEPVPMLVAEVEGELRAALPLDGGPAIATPFQRTAELVAMLAKRVRGLGPRAPSTSTRRWLPIPAPSRAPVACESGCDA